MNETIVEALAEGLRLTDVHRKRRDLADIAGTWKADEGFEDAIAAEDQVGEER